MIIRAKRTYFDKQRKVTVATGDTYEVTEERGAQIIGVGYAEEVQAVEAEKPKRAARKKKAE